jgi:hypothetical protein
LIVDFDVRLFAGAAGSNYLSVSAYMARFTTHLRAGATHRTHIAFSQIFVIESWVKLRQARTYLLRRPLNGVDHNVWQHTLAACTNIDVRLYAIIST